MPNSTMDKAKALQILREHKLEFARDFGVEEIGIFGSYASDRATPQSDMDIFAKMPPKFDRVVRLQERLEKLLGCRVDLIRLRSRMNARLRENIQREGLCA